jgi:glyoxylase-like metal-dependent hydrolase (beta-lactamase superfamily II)
VEIAPGIYRIESVLGPRPFSQYLLRGDRSMLVDTGILSTPADVILPFFETIGFDPRDLDFVLISHADVDHFGGNAAMREAAPKALFCAHERDVAWIEDRQRILRERYGWYAAHGPGADYDADTKSFLREAMGEDVPVDLQLTGGERFRLGAELMVEVIELPGHTKGHIGLWEPRSRTAVIVDGLLGNGLLNMEGEVIHPPPYFDAAIYRGAVELVAMLDPELLLTAHYAPMAGDDAKRFIEESGVFIDRARQATRDALQNERQLTLAEAVGIVGDRLGPYSSFANELGGPVRAHLDELVAVGLAERLDGERPPAWRWCG